MQSVLSFSTLDFLVKRHALRTLASRDPLAGIANRRWFEQTLVGRLQEGSAYPCCLMMVDRDGFKEINDSHRHGAGDAVLCMIADVLQRATDGVDSACVGRIGADEFEVLLPSTQEEQAVLCAQDIRNGAQVLGVSSGYGATVSIAVAMFRTRGSRSELLLAADQAMYRAKAAGRNTVRV